MRYLLFFCFVLSLFVGCTDDTPTDRDTSSALDLTPIQIRTAATYVRRDQKLASRYNLRSGGMSHYCPPQPTVYDWHVTFAALDGGEPLRVAVTDDGEAWLLDPVTFQRTSPPNLRM